jgi:hypothetical protein
VLEWHGPDPANEAEIDSCERRYDLLERLEIAELTLVEETSQARSSAGRNPYDHSPRVRRKSRIE